ISSAGEFTLTATKTGGSASGESAPFRVAAGPAASLRLNSPGDIVAGGARAAYTVSRVDAYGNAVTSGSLTVHLFTSSDGANAAFYDAETGGNAITQVTIPD